MRTKGIFIKRCPYCNGTNLYLRRTFPETVMGCKDCDNRIDKLKEKGFSQKEAEKFIIG